MKSDILKSGIFETKFMDSRVKSEKMSTKEKILGYLVGPFGMLALLGYFFVASLFLYAYLFR